MQCVLESSSCVTRGTCTLAKTYLFIITVAKMFFSGSPNAAFFRTRGKIWINIMPSISLSQQSFERITSSISLPIFGIFIPGRLKEKALIDLLSESFFQLWLNREEADTQARQRWLAWCTAEALFHLWTVSLFLISLIMSEVQRVMQIHQNLESCSEGLGL